jgi:nucleoside-diphosphate kinase
VAQEITLVLVKPHAVRAYMVVRILNKLMVGDLHLVGLKYIWPHQQMVENHYRDHRSKDYFPWLCAQLIGQPVAAIAIRGVDAVERVRKIAGDKDPMKADQGTIREIHRFTSDTLAASRARHEAVDNVVHTADSLETAERELKIWFRPDELLP